MKNNRISIQLRFHYLCTQKNTHNTDIKPVAPDMLSDTYFTGSDYSSFDLEAADPDLCKQRCMDDPECRSCTYLKPGVQGDSAGFQLKNAVTEEKSDESCLSWIKT